MTIGQLLKQYRMEKLKTQAEWTAGLVSTSYYSKVERDQHRITADDLIALLHANQIEPWDFFSRLNQEDRGKKEQSTIINQAITDAYYRNDKDELRVIEKMIAQSDLDNKKERLLFIKAMILITEERYDDLSADEKKTLKELIFNNPNMDKKGLVMYCDLMAFYGLESNLLLSKQMINKFGQSTDSGVREALLGIIGNMLGMCIEKGQFNSCAFFLQAARKIPTRPELLFYKNAIFFFENIIAYHYDQKPDHLQKAWWAVDYLKLLGMPEYSQQLVRFIDKNKDK